MAKTKVYSISLDSDLMESFKSKSRCEDKKYSTIIGSMIKSYMQRDIILLDGKLTNIESVKSEIKEKGDAIRELERAVENIESSNGTNWS